MELKSSERANENQNRTKEPVGISENYKKREETTKETQKRTKKKPQFE